MQLTNSNVSATTACREKKGQDFVGQTSLKNPGAIEVRVYRDIKNVDAAEWDRILDPDELQQSHRFIRLTQDSEIEQAEYWHLMFYADGELCGIATLTRLRLCLDLLASGFVQLMAKSVRKCWNNFLRCPVLFCGLPVSFGQSCLKIAPWADRSAVFTRLAETMYRIAHETDTKLICLKEFTTNEAARLKPLEDMGFISAPSLPSCTLPIVWDSVSAYLRSMTSGYRRQVRATLRSRNDAGLTVHVSPCFSPATDEIHNLYLRVIQRARYRMETLPREFFDRLDADLGDQSTAILCKRQNRLLGAAILLHTPNVTTFLLTGLDDEADRKWQVYPNLVWEIVSQAIQSGAARLEMGQTSTALKSRFGAVESPRCLYLKHRRRGGHSFLRRMSGSLFPIHDFPKRRVFHSSVGEGDRKARNT